MTKAANALINETSPYLLQHAYNPVDWKAWHEETLELAKKQNKLLIISIGYATCHWCHVMEHESFENNSVAEVMNKHFVSIKVDREERPDIDQIYMDAIQLLTGQGGWPLNIVALPDGRPIWGAMYAPRERWIRVLNEIAGVWQEQPDKLIAYAQRLTSGVRQNVLISTDEKPATPLTTDDFQQIIEQWQERFDHEWGGMNRAPKFPQPTVYRFLLKQAWLTQDTRLLDFVELTLEKMAFGGIYDHLRGGFARYSTDIKWHVPHFEKMLYDNAQLVSLYANAYKLTTNKCFKKVVEETLDFVLEELYDNTTGGFYSALDADSINAQGNLEEGAYYTWTKEELKQILGDDFDLFANLYNINPYGYWEHDKYVLIRQHTDEHFAGLHHLQSDELNNRRKQWQTLLKNTQRNRQRPALDDKSLTAWNALMIQGFLDAYKALGTERYLDTAKKGIDFIFKHLKRDDGGFYRSYKVGKAHINAYLDDYALLIQVLLEMNSIDADPHWITKAKALADYTIKHFYDTASGFFYFTSDTDSRLFHRKIDLTDDVIPSSNAVMAHNLFKLSHYSDQTDFENMALSMLNKLSDKIKQYPTSFMYWLILGQHISQPYTEFVATGKEAQAFLKDINSHFYTNVLFAGSTQHSDEALFKNRVSDDTSQIFICKNRTCLLPVNTVAEAIALMNKKG